MTTRSGVSSLPLPVYYAFVVRPPTSTLRAAIAIAAMKARPAYSKLSIRTALQGLGRNSGSQRRLVTQHSQHQHRSGSSSSSSSSAGVFQPLRSGSSRQLIGLASFHDLINAASPNPLFRNNDDDRRRPGSRDPHDAEAAGAVGAFDDDDDEHLMSTPRYDGLTFGGGGGGVGGGVLVGVGGGGSGGGSGGRSDGGSGGRRRQTLASTSSTGQGAASFTGLPQVCVCVCVCVCVLRWRQPGLHAVASFRLYG